MEVRANDSKYRSIIDEEEKDWNEDADEEDTDPLPPNIEDESVQDCTMEIVERLLVAESTLLQEDIDHEGTKQNGEHTELEKTTNSIEDFLLQSFEPSQNDLISKRVDDIEKIVQDLRNNLKGPQKTTQDTDMSSVAPWDNNGNGFAFKYMQKNWL